MNFYLSRFRFFLRPVGKLSLPPYKGATLRGGFGYVFKDLVCVKPDKDCSTCLIQDRCPYYQIFETPVPKDSEIMRKYTKAPHPFVLTPPLDERTEFSPSDELAFELVLIGYAIDYLPYFIYTFEELGRRGIGRERSKFQVLRVEIGGLALSAGDGGSQAALPAIYDGATKSFTREIAIVSFADIERESLAMWQNDGVAQISLEFLTPVRLWTGGDLDCEITFTNFMKALLRRIQLLQFFHCIRPARQGRGGQSRLVTDQGNGDEGILTVDHIRQLLKLSESVTTTRRSLRYREQSRFSTRQDEETPLSGFTGSITFSFPSKEVLQEFIPYLFLGSFLHVGKGSSFGLGKFGMTGAPPRDPGDLHVDAAVDVQQRSPS